MGVGEPVTVTLISDATGALGRHVLQAVFTQFPPGSFTLKVLPFVNSDDALARCLQQLPHATGLIVHATIYDRFKQRIEAACRQHDLPVYDLTGPIMAFLVSASGKRPEPGYHKLHELTPGYFERVEAIEYTIAHDDGGGLRTLDHAEIVLTGVSRTTKTPTSMVLAMHGYRVANIPLVKDLPPPSELLRVPVERVVCLTVHPAQLATMRATRARGRLGFDGGYAHEPTIQEELVWAQELSLARGWRVLDVTGRAVEETAAHVIELAIRR